MSTISNEKFQFVKRDDYASEALMLLPTHTGVLSLDSF